MNMVKDDMEAAELVEEDVVDRVRGRRTIHGATLEYGKNRNGKKKKKVWAFF